MLRRLAQQGGRTVIAVIHQPAGEVFEAFDCVALLAAGSTVYFGPTRSAYPFFASTLGPAPRGRSEPEHILHCVNADFADVAATNAAVQRLVAAYPATEASRAMRASLAQLSASPASAEFRCGGAKPPSGTQQTAVLTQRALLTNARDIGVFWMRLAMYVLLCLCIGFLYFREGHGWKDVYSRAALLFFVVAFLTFMSISAFPAFVEDMKVFTRERLNGYYDVGTFVAANTLASSPFILLIAVTSTCAVYFIANLNYGGDRLPFFILCLFLSLAAVESLMMAIAPLISHFLMGIAAGAGILGFFMLVTGFFQPTAQLPRPVFLYPLHYVSFQTYAWYGFMNNEFRGTAGWAAPARRSHPAALGRGSASSPGRRCCSTGMCRPGTSGMSACSRLQPGSSSTELSSMPPAATRSGA